MTTWMDGRSLAAELEVGLRDRVDALHRTGITPTLAIVVAGTDERTASYIRAKQAAAERVGIQVNVHRIDPGYELQDTHYETTTNAYDQTRHIHDTLEALNTVYDDH